MTKRLITDQTEITGLTTIDWQQPRWMETTLLTDGAVQLATAKTYVFSDSVLCLGGISIEPVKAWESKFKWFLETLFWKHVISMIWIGSTENKWNSSGKISKDSLHWEFSTGFNRWWLNQSMNLSNSKEGSSSGQCAMKLVGENERTEKIVLQLNWFFEQLFPSISLVSTEQ